MRFYIEDKFILEGIECKVAFVDSYGNAYVAPEMDGDELRGEKLLMGLVFAVVNPRGYDRLGNKIRSIISKSCGAV